MSIQAFVMKNRKLTNSFMSSRSSSFWKKAGPKNAQKILTEVIGKVPAYRDFLKKNNINPDNKNVLDFNNFTKLPIMDKKNYVLLYPWKQLCFDFDDIYTIERSSGYSNVTVFWPRLPEEDALFPSYIEYAFVQFYGIDKKRTLVIMTLALGTWVSGEKMAQALRMTAMKQKYKMSVISPGANLEDTLEIVKTIGNNFEQIIIVGYPPFLQSVIEEGERRGISWSSLNVKLGLGGEGYSEKWREMMGKKINLPEKELLGVSGGYGAADLGMSIGREYPLTVLIRKMAENNPELSQTLFKSKIVPALLQYNPRSHYIEEFQNELLFTIKAGIPVIRYNIHDRGGVIGFDEMMETLKKFNCQIEKKLVDYGYAFKNVWKLPFFYVFGRTDGTVSVSGMNVYTENIDAALHQPETEAINSFKMSKRMDSDGLEKLSLAIELKRGFEKMDEEKEKELALMYQKAFLEKLLQINKDFAYVYNARPDKMKPIITLYYHGTGPFQEDIGKIKRNYKEN